jgi:putative regulatory protein, FmdB family
VEYTYKCDKCGEFTVNRSMKDDAVKTCPKCGQPVKKVYSPAGIIWKCSGAFGKSK